MLISPHGLAIWLDSETNFPFEAGAYTGVEERQRIAGRVFGLNVSTESGPPEKLCTTEYASTGNRWTAFMMHEQTGRLAVAEMDGAIEVREYI